MGANKAMGYASNWVFGEMDVTEKEALIYEQNCHEFRSLNSFFWQIPLIMMTLNAGLWFSVATFDLSVPAQRTVLAFAAFSNLVMVAGLWRLRQIMHDLLTRIHVFQGTTSPGQSKLIQYLFQTLLVFAAAGAIAASFYPGYFFASEEEASTGEVLRG